MNWDEMCDGHVETGKQINLATICGPNVDHDKRDKTGMPDAAILSNMVASAQRLNLKGEKGRGQNFTVVSCVVANGGLNITPKLKVFVSFKEKKGAAECYEAKILPMEIQDGHVLVHQDVAPCKRCRAGYKAWAQQRISTIVVSADEGYDGSGDNKVFIFTPTGLIFFG